MSGGVRAGRGDPPGYSIRAAEKRIPASVDRIDKPMKKRGRAALVALGLFVGAAAIFLVRHTSSEAVLHRSFPPNRHLVLFETDLPLLLSGCRDVIEQREGFPVASQPGEEDKLRQGWYMPDGGDVALPEPVRSLNPSYVVISQSRLRAELYHCTRECAHFGIVAFRSGVVPEVPTDLIDADAYSTPKRDALDQMAVRMVPGLWFYDTRLSHAPLQRRLQEFLERDTRSDKEPEQQDGEGR